MKLFEIEMFVAVGRSPLFQDLLKGRHLCSEIYLRWRAHDYEQIPKLISTADIGNSFK